MRSLGLPPKLVEVIFPKFVLFMSRTVVHIEVGVVEDIESLKPQFKIEVFREPRPLNKRRVRAPVTRAVNRSQAQTAEMYLPLDW